MLVKLLVKSGSFFVKSICLMFDWFFLANPQFHGEISMLAAFYITMLAGEMTLFLNSSWSTHHFYQLTHHFPTFPPSSHLFPTFFPPFPGPAPVFRCLRWPVPRPSAGPPPPWARSPPWDAPGALPAGLAQGNP